MKTLIHKKEIIIFIFFISIYFYGFFEGIYLVDDWNWQKVRDGTNQAIKENKCEILYKKEIYTRSNNPNNDWHNGICIFVLKK